MQTRYFVYVLLCKDGSLYTGITTDVARRFNEHVQGVGGAYTRSHKVRRIVYTEELLGRGAASRREAEIKKMSKNKKLDLVRSAAILDA